MKNCYHIKISLNETNPLIWRELLVPDDYTFYQLHHTLQVVMGWTNSHLFEFNIEGYQIGYVFEDMMDDESHVINCKDTRMDSLITTKGETFTYWYDFGDSWYHTIVIENLESVENTHQLPFCLAGELKCPPEDCGGIGGFYHVLSVLADKKHTEYKDMKRWVGAKYNPEIFDLVKINKQLKRIDKYIDSIND